jgi:ribosomal protein S18 acetylase RimI-like enzyme
MFSLRSATIEDLDSIAEVWHRGWREGHIGHVPAALLPYRELESFRQRVPERLSGSTVAVLGATVIGFVTVHDDELEQLYVAESARGRGVAVALIRHGEAQIGERFARAWLAVAAGNARARRFYAREGWSDAGAFDYAAQIEGGTVPVPCHRYEKRVSR